MKRFASQLLVVVLAISITAGCAFAQAKKRPPPDETIVVHSKTMTDEQFLKDKGDAAVAVELSAEIRFPNSEKSLPVVIIVHGSDGPMSGASFAWRNILDRAGIATVRLDSFTGRGIKTVESDQSQLGFLNAIFDVYRTVETIAKDPRFDPNRIVVMGSSRGGLVALYASLKRFHRLYGPQNGELAAYFPLYASCSLGLDRESELVSAPVRLFHGELDDWVPEKPCKEFVARAIAAGNDITLTSFPNARHAFDNPQAASGAVVANAQTARNCSRKEIDGVITNTDTGKPFSYANSCIEMAPTVGYDKYAAESAAKSIIETVGQLDR